MEAIRKHGSTVWRWGGSTRSGPSPALVIPAVAVSLLLVVPAAYLLVTAGQSPQVALDQIFSTRTAGLLLRTSGLAATVTAATVALSVPLAWLTTRTDLPGRRVWTVLLVLPFVIPSYIGAYLLISALGPKGLAQQALSGPFGVDRLPEIYGFLGAWLALSLFTYPYVLITLRAALMKMDPRLEEVSVSLGHTRLQTFRRVVLPQLVPAIGVGSLLVALYVFSDFGAVSLMQFDSFTRAIFTLYKSGFDRVGAAAIALVLSILTVSVLVLELRSGSNQKRYFSAGQAGRAPLEYRLGRWRGASLVFCGFVTLVSLVLPVSILVYWCTSSLSANVELGPTLVNALHSLLAGGLAAVVAVICAIPITLLSVRYPSRSSKIMERLSYTGHALPGIVVALALVFFGVRVALPLYQKLPMLIAAYLILFIPFAVGALRTSLLQINPSLEEAARSLGRRPLEVLRTVTAPLAAPGAFAGAALVFLSTVKELPATLLLAPIGFETLATDIWNQTTVGFFERGAIPSLILLAVSAYPLYMLTTADR